MRITLAVFTLAAVAGISTLAGSGPLYPEMLVLTCLYLVVAALGEPARQKAVTGLLWCSILVSAVALIQVPFVPRPPSIFRSPNFLGAFAAIMLFLAWRSRHRAAIVANALSLCLSQSRGALLAAGAGCCVMLWRRSRLAAILAPCIALAAVLVVRSGAEEYRLALWRLGWQAFSQRPVTGWGPGGFGIWPSLNQFHSIPLDLAIGCGIVGVAAGSWLFIEAWIAGHDYRPFLAAWAVQGLFLPEHPATMIPFVVVLGLVSGRRVEIPGDEAGAAAIVNHDEPLADRLTRAGRA